MKLRHLILSFSLVFFQVLPSQTEWLSIDTKERSADRNFKKVIQIINDNTNELVTFFQYYNFFVAYLHDADGNLVHTFSAKALPKIRNNYLGTSINDSAYTIFFQNDYGVRFSALHIDFEKSEFEFTDLLEVQSNIETIIGSFEYKSQIHILTSEKRSSKLKLYKLKNHKDITSQTFDFSHVTFKTPRGFDVTLDRFIDGGYNDSSASLIENNEPGALEASSKKNKMFLDGSSLILTNDFYDNATTYIAIDLENGSSYHKNFPKKSFNKKDRGSKSNSFVLDDNFFNIYVSKEKLDFSVYDINSEELVKSIIITEDDPITFKNSPIILEGGENYRELDRTKQFLRKVSNSNAGIFAYKQNNKYIITLGSSETREMSTQFAVMGGFFGGLAFGITTAILTPSYDSYTRTKSTRIECLFDENFSSIEGTIPENGFDKIENFIASQTDIKFKNKSIFKLNNEYVLGYFEKDTGLYKYIKISQ